MFEEKIVQLFSNAEEVTIFHFEVDFELKKRLAVSLKVSRRRKCLQKKRDEYKFNLQRAGPRVQRSHQFTSFFCVKRGRPDAKMPAGKKTWWKCAGCGTKFWEGREIIPLAESKDCKDRVNRKSVKLPVDPCVLFSLNWNCSILTERTFQVQSDWQCVNKSEKPCDRFRI